MIDVCSFNVTRLEVVLPLDVPLEVVALMDDTSTTSSGRGGGGGGGWNGALYGGDGGNGGNGIKEEVEMKFCMLNERLLKYKLLNVPIDTPRQKISKNKTYLSWKMLNKEVVWVVGLGGLLL